MGDEPRRAKGRRNAEVTAVALACLAPVAAIALLPADGRILAVPLAVVAGATAERHRAGRRARPLTLAATPREWRRAVAAVGWGYALAGVTAAAAAAMLLALPALRERPPEPHAAERSAPRGAGSTSGEVELARYALGRTIRLAGASFRVSVPAAAPWVRTIRSRSPGKHAKWVLVGVEARNRGRRRFNPNALAYRLADARGNRYAPLVGGGTGPASLSTTGFLAAGERAQARLGFRVPRAARRLALVFEPVPDGSLQVRVPLG